MATNRLSSVLHSLLHRVAPAASGEVSDAELLQRFVRSRDEAAFELLLWRHGPMVLSVCQRLVHNEQDAEDAFQATFLILVRKAGSIGKREALASWLYKVAYRVACRARPPAPVVCNIPSVLQQLPASESPDDIVGRDLRSHLDDELSRLPETYRRPIILCYLEGKTHDEAARLLGWPKGTVATRLARGRERLRLRLGRRGWALSSAALASVLTDKALAGAVSAELVRATLGGAAAYAAGTTTAGAILSAKSLALTEGVLRIMWYSKMKLVAALFLAVALAGTGIGLAVRQACAGAGPDDPAAAQADPALENAQVQQPGGKKKVLKGNEGVSKGDVADLQREIVTLRLDLDAALQEIKEMKAVLRLPSVPPEQGPLYRGKPARFWLEQMKDGDPAYRIEAVKALGALAQQQKSLMLPLVAALKEKEKKVGDAASQALGNLGAEAVPALLEVAKDKTALAPRIRALQAMCSIGPDAKAAVPLLIDWVKEEDARVRSEVILALGNIGPGAKAAVPVLIEALKDQDVDIRDRAVGALGAIGPEAKSAIPALVDEMGRRLEAVQKGIDLQNKKGNRFPNSFSISHSTSPYTIIQVVSAIDPTIRDVLPADVRFASTDVENWPIAYDALRKKYPPTQK
jgi:RNA polymerase sigma factor (sigma-70 family)